MKARCWLALLAAILALLMAPGLALAVYEFPICTGPGDQSYPAVSGSIVLWDQHEGAYGIYGCDLSTGRQFVVSSGAGMKAYPAISGHIVVWQDHRNLESTGADIYGYDMSTGREFPICTAPGHQQCPEISGNIVVWEDWRNDPGGVIWNADIYGYDLSTGQEFPVCTDLSSQRWPAISGSIVVWQDLRNGTWTGRWDDNWDIYAKDLRSGQEFPLSQEWGGQCYPRISGNTAVWKHWGHGSLDELCAHDLLTGQTWVAVTVPTDFFTHNGLRDYDISGSIVVWQTNDEGKGDEFWVGNLYGKDLVTGEEFVVCSVEESQISPAVSDNVVVWADGRNWATTRTDIYGAVLDGTAGLPTTQVVSSYPSADEWASGIWHPHRGQLHAHRMPDKWYAGVSRDADYVLEKYEDAKYDFLAITEHHMNFDAQSWPQVFVASHVPDIVSMVGSTEDTADNHILGIAFGPALDTDVLGSTVFGGSYVDQLQVKRERLLNITQNGGLAFIPHPDLSRYWWNPRMLYDLDGYYDGVEVYSAGSALGAYLETYKDVLLGTGDRLLAEQKALNSMWEQGFADDTWETLLRRGATVWAAAGDDYHPDVFSSRFFDNAAVVAWTRELAPDEDRIREALRAGRFYACKGGTHAPWILAYWVDVATHTISIQMSAPYEVVFVRGRYGWPWRRVEVTPIQRSDGTYVASYFYQGDELYVRAEVHDWFGNISWLQPIWMDKVGSTTVTFPPGAGGLAAAQGEPVVVRLEGAELLLSSPQSGLTEVTVALLNGGARPSGPPMGYLSLCYGFTPTGAAVSGASLSISYFPDSIRGFHEDSIAIYRYDETAQAWLRLASEVRVPSGAVTAQIDRLGRFAVSAEPPVDIAPPTVTITSPAPGVSIAAPTTVTADASDDQGVASVRFYLDGWPISTDDWEGDGFVAILDPANYTSGTKTITAMAEDGVGNEASAETIVTLAGLMLQPVITITSPAEAAVIWGDLNAAGLWSGQLPMTLGVSTLDGQPLTVTQPTDGPWQLSIPLTPSQAGERTLKATGFDIYGNRAEDAVRVLLRVFADIPFDQWARSFIYAIAQAGISQGYPDGTYGPTLPVTRDQMAVYISRALAGGGANVPSGPSVPSFPDVPKDYWAFDHVEYAKARNVVEGYPDGFYHPEVELDRGQMGVFIARALVAPGGDAAVPDPVLPAHFPDVTATNDWSWCHKHVEYIADQGVVTGYPDGLYHPEYVCTRDQMAVYVARAFALPM